MARLNSVQAIYHLIRRHEFLSTQRTCNRWLMIFFINDSNFIRFSKHWNLSLYLPTRIESRSLCLAFILLILAVWHLSGFYFSNLGSSHSPYPDRISLFVFLHFGLHFLLFHYLRISFDVSYLLILIILINYLFRTWIHFGKWYIHAENAKSNHQWAQDVEEEKIANADQDSGCGDQSVYMGCCIRVENTGLLLALIDIIRENEGAAIYYPYDIEDIYPHLKKHLKARLGHSGVIGAAPEYHGQHYWYSKQ